jgi:hypothetical protein
LTRTPFSATIKYRIAKSGFLRGFSKFRKIASENGRRFYHRKNNISSDFIDLREDKDFFNVTLACDDEQIQAHNVILSACSPYFKNILCGNPHQHPLFLPEGREVHRTSVRAQLHVSQGGQCGT